MRPSASDLRSMAEGRGRGLPGAWSLTLYPDAREASGRFMVPTDKWLSAGRVIPGEAANPERSAKMAASRERAVHCTLMPTRGCKIPYPATTILLTGSMIA